MRLATFGLSVGLLALGCGGTDEPAPSSGRVQLERTLAHAVDKVVLPAVRAFDEEVAVLAREATDELCAAPSLGALADLQDRWRSTAERWAGVAPLNFGPLQDDLIFPTMNFIESMRARGDDYTEAVRESLQAALASDAPLDEVYFATLTFDRVGLLALEVLLFESSAEAHPTDLQAVVDDLQANPRKCDYLSMVAFGLSDRASRLARAWRDGIDGAEPFAAQMKREALDDGATPAAALLTALKDHLDYVKRRKLEGTLDGQLSGTFYANQRATLRLYSMLLEGSDNDGPGRTDGFGFLNAMEANGASDDAATVRASLAQAQTAAQAEDRAALTTAVGLLDGHFKREIPEGLGVDLGINFSDGD